MFKTTHTYPSEKNGEVYVWRTFPWERWQLGASGYDQTTHYTNAMWKFVTKDIAQIHKEESQKNRKSKKIEAVFIGGLGGAGQVSILQKYFPGCHITVAEHDKVIIEVVEKYHLLPVRKHTHIQEKDIEIIAGDLYEVLRAQAAQGKTYDLLCIDVFTGEHPSAQTAHQASVELIKAALAQGGFVVANVFKNPEYLGPLAAAFTHHKKIYFRANTLGIFWEGDTPSAPVQTPATKTRDFLL